MSQYADKIAARFLEDVKNCSTIPLTIGHINRTFKVVIDGTPKFLLQQINTNVFSNVEGLMRNTDLVLKTLKISMEVVENGLMVQNLVPLKNGLLYLKDEQNNYWRMFTYIPDAQTIEVVSNCSEAFEGGKAYGKFLVGVSVIKPEQLHITLPDFHSLEIRYKAFTSALKLNLSKRKTDASEEIEFANYHFPDMMLIPRLISSGKIPNRVVHNDTKFNNLIFSKNGKAIAVTDLDTVMPGSALYDFGDSIRTAANSVSEDELNPVNVKFEISVFEAYARGYLEAAGHILNKDETTNFPEASLFMTYLIGLRFLTDFLNGDIYFQTHYLNHNLVRARVQFELFRKMQQQLAGMHEIIKNITS
ncbi:MAG: aminoglycoside phosphotransferase family protein [Lentimicrobium sp.]|nr:aminoglycoside phosphotransferase family protein [Lentimicrobium sp.]